MAHSSGDDVLKIGSFQYLHVLDTNLNTVKVEVGPKTFTRLEHEKVVFGPEKMIVVPPRHFVVIANPVYRGKDGKEEYDEHGQVRLKHGDAEVRFEQEPFALFPGEKISGGIQPLQVVAENTALRLRAKRDFVDRYAKDAQGRPIKRRAGEEWLFAGLATYFPQSEEEVVQLSKAWIIKPNQALCLRAKDDCVDYTGKLRKAGEMWHVRREGAYLPAVNEIEVGDGIVDAFVLTPKTGIHVKAAITFTNAAGVERKSGEEWLVTREDFETYIPDVHEIVYAHVPLTVLNHRQWCVIGNPVDEDTGKSLLGEVKYVKGPATFFLRPGEFFQTEPSPVFVLSPHQALWVSAKEAFVDHRGVKRNAGDKWLIYGAGEYWPPVQVTTHNTVSAFFGIDALGLYFFQPAPFFVCIVLFIIALILLNRYIPTGSVSSTTATAAAKAAAKAATPKAEL